MTTVQVSPEWYAIANKNLAEIEAHAAEYEDPEEGDVAPQKPVFDAVRAFLTTLNAEGKPAFEVPRMFVSPAGHLVLAYGNKDKGVDLRFAPEVEFFFKGTGLDPVNGTGVPEAIKLVLKHFS